MSGIQKLLTKLGLDNGIEIDPDEFDALGLSDDEVDLSDPLPGKAAGVVEIFLAAPSTQTKATVGDDGLVWTPIMYEGQWALRPDGRGGKRRVPLKIVAGSSKNQRREIGLKDIKAAFDDQAIESVTVPETHENKPTENHGYVEALKIAKVKLGDDGKTVNALMAGMDVKIPETKRKMELGAVAGRSAGLLYDYERTDTGKKYPVALEHVCLTSRQWLRGMPRFGRKLAMLSDDLPIASLVLADEGPTEEEYVLALADAPDDEDFLADAARLLWPQEESPEWLRGQVNAILDAKRAEKRKSDRSAPMYVEESTPYYRCKDAKPSEALICDGYDDGANHWIAPISVVDGKVELSSFTKWQSVDKAWVADSSDESSDDPPGLSERADEVINLSGLQIAQKARKDRTQEPDNEPPRGGGNMADDNTSTVQLSDEAKRLIQAAEARAEAAENKADSLSQSVNSLMSTANVNRAEAFITELKGMGLDEEHGFGGMLVEIEQVMLADDGGPALQSDHFADDRNKTGELTLSDAFRRVFGALKTAEGVTLKLGEVVKPPTEKTKDDLDDGKPPKGEEDVDESMLSDEELLRRQEKDHPGTLAAAGIKLSDNGDNGGGK